jgi:hypothetical protein
MVSTGRLSIFLSDVVGEEVLECDRLNSIASAMQKTGQSLTQLAITPPSEILNRLRDEFSITTAEELVSAAANRASHLRHALNLTLEQWIDLLLPAYQAVKPSVRDFFAEPLASPFGRGAVLNKTENLPADYQSYLG